MSTLRLPGVCAEAGPREPTLMVSPRSQFEGTSAAYRRSTFSRCLQHQVPAEHLRPVAHHLEAESQGAVLRLLREAGLVESEKVGQWVYYRIKRDAARALRDRVQQLLRAFA